MTTYIIFNSIILLALVIAFSFLFVKLRKTEKPSDNSEKETDAAYKMDWKVTALLIISASIVGISFFLPFIFTRPSINSDFNFTDTGAIGDTIGGLMSPFIALAGVMVTGLAFYIQFLANKQQRELFIREQLANKAHLQVQIDNQKEQIAEQQFESQFYEMLRLHRENITEMNITGYNFQEEKEGLKKYEKVTSGRKVFVTMQTEFECILGAFSSNNTLDDEGFKKCYRIFFAGLDEFKRNNPNDGDLIKLLDNARTKHENPDLAEIKKNIDRKAFIHDSNLNINYKPFSGHASRLGHYFRHLYLIVKSIAYSPIVTDYNNKMKYLKLLRAQLSNHEQILLFYNWLSGYGNDWENEENSFFTEYCVIHNLWHDTLFNDKFIQDNVKFLRNKKVELRKGKMFEIDN